MLFQFVGEGILGIHPRKLTAGTPKIAAEGSFWACFTFFSRGHLQRFQPLPLHPENVCFKHSSLNSKTPRFWDEEMGLMRIGFSAPDVVFLLPPNILGWQFGRFGGDFCPNPKHVMSSCWWLLGGYLKIFQSGQTGQKSLSGKFGGTHFFAQNAAGVPFILRSYCASLTNYWFI